MSNGGWKENGTGKGSDHSRINKDKYDAGWQRIFGKTKKVAEDDRDSDDEPTESSELDD